MEGSKHMSVGRKQKAIGVGQVFSVSPYPAAAFHRFEFEIRRPFLRHCQPWSKIDHPIIDYGVFSVPPNSTLKWKEQTPGPCQLSSQATNCIPIR